MSTFLAINGTVRYVPPGSVHVRKTGASEKLTGTIQDRDTSATAYAPQRGDLVRLEEDGELVFGGPINRVVRTTIVDNVGTQTEFEAIDWTHLMDGIFVWESYPEQGAYVTIYDLVTKYLGDPFGVTWLSPTSGGMTLPAQSFDGETLRAVIGKLETITGLFFRINGDKAAAFEGKIATGITLTHGVDTKLLAPLGWEQAREQRATRVYVRIGSPGQGSLAHTQRLYGDGSRVVYLLDAIPRPGEVPASITVNRGSDAVATLGAYPDDYATHEWTYVAHYAPQNSRGEIVHNTALGTVLSGAHYIEVPLSLAYPITVRVEDEDAIDAGEIIERRYDHTDTLGIAEGKALADGYLRDQLGEPKHVTVVTRDHHLYPNCGVSLTFPDSLVSGDYLITETAVDDIGIPWEMPRALRKTHTCVETATMGKSVLDFLRGAGAGGSGSGGSSTVTVIPAGAIVLFESSLGGSRASGVAANGTWQRLPEARLARVPWDKVPSDVVVTARLLVAADSGTVAWRLVRASDNAVLATDSAVSSAWPSFTERSLVVPTGSGTVAYYIELQGSSAAPVYGIGAIHAGM